MRDVERGPGKGVHPAGDHVLFREPAMRCLACRTCGTAAQPSAGCAVLGVERASGPRRRIRWAKGDLT